MWTTGGGRFKVVTEPISAEERVAHRAPGAPDPVEARVTTQVKWWAALGCCFLLLEVYVIAAWIISGDAKPTPSDSAHIGPDGQLVTSGHP
jgi:hypothetical protein